MRSRANQLLNNVSKPEVYREELIESNGTSIALSIWESEKTNSTVVFLPGTMTHPLFYEEFLQLVAENGFNVIGVHPISHGKSPRIKKKYTYDDMLQNTRDAITYAIHHYNEEVFLMGSSQGGILTIAMAGLDSRIKAAFPHNILIPNMKDSIRVTSFPGWLKPFYKLMIGGMKMGAKLFPKMQIPISFYLNNHRIFGIEETKSQFYADPIGLTAYPLHFLASLFGANMDQISDGSIKCPVVVIASTGDPLFPFDYCQQVFDLIKAPHKEMLVFEEESHLIMNECVESIYRPIVAKLKEFC